MLLVMLLLLLHLEPLHVGETFTLCMPGCRCTTLLLRTTGRSLLGELLLFLLLIVHVIFWRAARWLGIVYEKVDHFDIFFIAVVVFAPGSRTLRGVLLLLVLVSVLVCLLVATVLPHLAAAVRLLVQVLRMRLLWRETGTDRAVRALVAILLVR